MENNILFINACVRKNSRTLLIAEKFLSFLPCKASRYDLLKEYEIGNLKPLDEDFISFRNKCSESGNFSSPAFDAARKFAGAGMLVIAAPYWDFSFPSLLKIYIENICVDGLSFRYLPDGRPQGLCKAEHLVYISTAGGPVYGDFGFGYIRDISCQLLGITKCHIIQAENLDIKGSNEEKILSRAFEQAKILAEELSHTVK
ncbi:MAG: NAD(P)H-dependent oxidoreductase [Elusimicrobiales bacterium]|nr:NAD(P)H-dependent oxidoreductase [Elusimicrobiales bacterium]